jgi:hypothetical protein
MIRLKMAKHTSTVVEELRERGPMGLLFHLCKNHRKEISIKYRGKQESISHLLLQNSINYQREWSILHLNRQRKGLVIHLTRENEAAVQDLEENQRKLKNPLLKEKLNRKLKELLSLERITINLVERTEIKVVRNDFQKKAIDLIEGKSLPMEVKA